MDKVLLGDIVKYKDHPVAEWEVVKVYDYGCIVKTPSGREHIVQEQPSNRDLCYSDLILVKRDSGRDLLYG